MGDVIALRDPSYFTLLGFLSNRGSRRWRNIAGEESSSSPMQWGRLGGGNLAQSRFNNAKEKQWQPDHIASP